MSYSFSVPATPKTDLDTAIATAADAAIAVAAEEFQPSQRDHVEAIRLAIGEILPVFGRDGDDVAVSISGHSNPDHAPSEGWSNEHISLSISIVPAVGEKPAPAGPDADAGDVGIAGPTTTA